LPIIHNPVKNEKAPADSEESEALLHQKDEGARLEASLVK
jgi:hypothetical protein